MKKSIFAILLLFSVVVQATVINIPDDYPTIQSGIDVATTDDTVFVQRGSYVENINITKRIALIGERVGMTIIEGDGYFSTIRVRATGVQISDLTITGSGDLPEYASEAAAIHVADADSVAIERCKITQSEALGIYLGSSEGSLVQNCRIITCAVGVQIGHWHPDSVITTASRKNVIANNIILDIEGIGIWFSHGAYHDSNIVRSNLINFCSGNGIYQITSRWNDISYNYLYYIGGHGVELSHCMCGGDGNMVHHNSFVSCGYTNGGRFAADDGALTEYWYSANNSEGNYWGDYTGVDGNGDGIGDTPYPIPLSGGRVDSFPLIAMPDIDLDGIPDSVDLCPAISSNYADTDMDFIGNECDDCSDFDGDGWADPGTPSPLCSHYDNCISRFNPDQEDYDGDGVGDSCDFVSEEVALLSSGCMDLTISSDGSFGEQGDYGGIDYAGYGDCDPTASPYLYDGSPIVIYPTDDDTLCGWSIHGSRNPTTLHLLGWGQEWSPYEVGDGVIYAQTGTLASPDFTLGIDLTWYLDDEWAGPYCRIVIQQLRLYSMDGYSHDGVAIGNVVDWDVPSDDGALNAGGYDIEHNLIYQQGVELDGSGCQSSDGRFAGQSLLAVYINDSCAVGLGSEPYGAYAARNDSMLWNIEPQQLYDSMNAPGYRAVVEAPDMHTVMTFLGDFQVNPDDTISIYSALVTVMDGNIVDLQNEVDIAREWLDNNLVDWCACCIGMTGDINGDGAPVPDITDLVRLVDYMFESGAVLYCDLEADVDGSGYGPDISDLVYLVTYMFSGGAPPASCQ